MEYVTVAGVSANRDEAKITLLRVADRPGVAAGIFGPLAEANINVDMIVQNISARADTTDLTFTVTRGEFARADGRHVPGAVDAVTSDGLGDPPIPVYDQQAPGLRRGAGAVLGRQAADHDRLAACAPQSCAA